LSVPWKSVLELRSDRSIAHGSEAALCDAVRNGADLRIYTEFRHDEHIDPSSDCSERIHETAEFRCTCLLDNRWSAGFMTLRQPIVLPDRFGPRASMSFFLYNQNGEQGIARPHLDGGPVIAEPGPSRVDAHHDQPKYHEQDHWDAGTNAPSSNFIYDFDLFRYGVRDDWQEVFSHTSGAEVVDGSIDALADAFSKGCEIKVGIRGLCSDLARDPGRVPDHEVFIQTGSCYFYSDRKLFIAGTHPIVRVAPAIPLKYSSRNWDFGWLMVRTDGLVSRLIYDPYTLRCQRSQGYHAIRWFVR